METFLQSKEVKIPKPNQANKVQVSPIDFKSSFARSLSNNNREDEEILKLSFSGEDSVQTQKTKVNNNRSIDVLKMTCDKNSHFKKIDCGEKTIIEYSDESFNRSDEDKLLWTVDQQFKVDDHSNSSDAEIFRLRKQCQNLIEENRRIHKEKYLNCSSLLAKSRTNNNNDHDQNVENVVLQTKLETLQWQLRQVENSRQMYRAIMEEVGKFLEKCHMSFDLIQHRERNKAIERSKSIANITKPIIKKDIDIRARSTINLCQETHKKGHSLSEFSYNTFKDFTWRRNGNKSKQSTIMEKAERSDEPMSLPFFDVQISEKSFDDTTGIDADKLAREAFRLSRTVHNFLNTHEPILTQSQMDTKTTDEHKNEFLFAIDDCQPSLRSTDESSVHSSSASSHEAHEDLAVLPKISSKSHHRSKVLSCHQTEDESGFSSMNSFHEIGLPLNSTFLSSVSSSADESQASECVKPKRTFENCKRNSLAEHRRYESVPISMNHTPKLKLLDDDGTSMKVLWV